MAFSTSRGQVMAEDAADKGVNSVALATELTIAWLGNPNVRATAEEVPAFLRSIHAAIGDLSQAGAATSAEPASEYAPAVPVRSSVKPDYLVSLIDGRKLKSLKRHLATHGLTPAEYRERYGLKADYPMVAANYSAQRREVAKKLGLGRKPGQTRAKTAAAAAPTDVPAKAVSKPKAAGKTAAKAAPAPRVRARKTDAATA